MVVQGFGSIGKQAARFLTADSQGTVFQPHGVAVAHLVALKNAGKSMLEYPSSTPRRVEKSKKVFIAPAVLARVKGVAQSDGDSCRSDRTKRLVVERDLWRRPDSMRNPP